MHRVPVEDFRPVGAQYFSMNQLPGAYATWLLTFAPLGLFGDRIRSNYDAFAGSIKNSGNRCTRPSRSIHASVLSPSANNSPPRYTQYSWSIRAPRARTVRIAIRSMSPNFAGR